MSRLISADDFLSGAPEFLSAAGWQNPRIEHVRLKPELSAVGRVIDVSGDQQEPKRLAWIAAFAPKQVSKLQRIIKVAETTGFPLQTAEQPNGVVLASGPIGLDRALHRILRSENAVDTAGDVTGQVLSYNPFKRVVARSGNTVYRYWAHPPGAIDAWQKLAQQLSVVLPPQQVGAHTIAQPWVAGYDLAKILDSTPTITPETRLSLAQSAQALAAVHSQNPPDRLEQRCVPTDLEKAAHGVAARVSSAELAAAWTTRFNTVAQTIVTELVPQPGVVWCHGDFSADQVVGIRSSHTAAPSTDPGMGAQVQLIDFDRMHIGPAESDIGSFIAVELLSGRTWTVQPFIDCYSAAALQPIDLDQVRVWTAFHVALRVAEPFRDYSAETAHHCAEAVCARIVLAERVLSQGITFMNTVSVLNTVSVRNDKREER